MKHFLFSIVGTIWHIICVILYCIDTISLQACTSPALQTLDGLSGLIFSHNFNTSNVYSSNTHCNWLIKVPVGHVIKLTFLTFQLEPDPNGCKKDSITVGSGHSPTSDIMGTFCGSVKPPVLVSFDRFMWISFLSNEYQNFKGFKASFTSVKTGVTCFPGNSFEMNNNILLHNSSGMLSGPTEVQSSQIDTLQCTWRVRVQEGYGIKLSFTTLKLSQASSGSGSNQNENTLEIHSGFLHSSYLIATIRRSEGTQLKPAVFYIPTNYMWIRLQSQSPKDTYIAATYKSVRKDIKTCSYVNYPSENANIHIQGTTGEISSPNYPDLYNGHISCIWTIKVPEGFKVKLTFTDFKLHSSADYLEVREGSSSSSLLMGNFAGPSNLPPDLYTSGRTMWIKFIITSNNSSKGFHARYSAVTSAQGACSTINTEKMNSNIWKTLSSGRFVSPSYPAKYPSDFRCVWRIAVPERFRVRLTFKSFDLEGNSCKYDYVEMRDGLSLTSPLIGGGRICGGTFLDDFYHSSGPNMLVLFFSDTSEEFKGFEAIYSSVLPEPGKCSSINTMEENNNIQLSGTSGVLSSPNFPKLFPYNIQCTWTITVPHGFRIVYRVSSFSLESDCSGEYLDVRDGSYPSSPHHDRFCGQKKPFHVLSTGRSLWIRFKTNKHLRHQGFNSSFVATPSGPKACSRENTRDVNNGIFLNDTSGQLSSPEFPLPYNNPIQCTWVLEALPRHRIELTFDVIDLPSTCEMNYVRVCQGRYSCSVARYTACGKGHRETRTDHIHSRGQLLWVHFRVSPDFRGRFTGFKASFRQAPEGICSNSYSASWNQNLWLTQAFSGIISSPGYPASVQSPIQCYWKITVPTHYTIKLFFEVFLLPPSCNDSCIRVYDGLDTTAPLIAELSGHRRPQVIFSSGRSLLLQFDTSSNLTSTEDFRFKASYSGMKTNVAEVRSSTKTQLTAVLIGVIVVALVVLSVFTLGYVSRKVGRRPRRTPSRDTSSLSRVSTFRETSTTGPDVVFLNLRRLPDVVIPSPSPEVTRFDNVLEVPTINDLSDLNIVEERPPSYDEAVHSENDSQAEREVETEVERENIGSVTEQGRDLSELGRDNAGFFSSTMDLSDQPPSYDTLFRAQESRNS